MTVEYNVAIDTKAELIDLIEKLPPGYLLSVAEKIGSGGYFYDTKVTINEGE